MIAATVIVGVAFSSRFGEDPSLAPSPLIGEPVPALDLPRLDGSGFLDLSEMPGEILVVNFWASWCVACRSEHPDLAGTAAAFAEKGVRFVGVVYQDDPESARAFLDELGWGYDYVLDPESRAAISFGVFGVPETYFVDRDGIIVGKITGESNAVFLGQTLDSILGGKRPGDRTVGTVQPAP